MKIARFLYNARYGINFKKPRLMGRMIKNYFDLIFLKGKPLRYVDINIGLACNLSCQHCFAENFKRPADTRRKELSITEWSGIFRQLHQMGNLAFGFTGGEPLIYAQLFDLIPLCQPSKSLILINTNGVLLTPELAAKLKGAGVDVLLISLDSALAEEHDRFRGKQGAYDKTLRAFDIAREANLKVIAVPTVSNQNVRSAGLKNIIEWARKERILVVLSLASPTGEWSGNQEIRLTPKDMEEINRLTADHPHVRRDFETNYLRMGCGAGIEKLYITPQGDVIPCPFMHISFGNVRDMDIATIRDKMLANPFLKGYHPACLTAEDTEFIDNFLPKEHLKNRALPTSEEVFDK